LRFAVSQNCILRTVANADRFGKTERSAECNPAIQQITNLRYDLGATQHSTAPSPIGFGFCFFNRRA
jgi:hypothetical protein